MLTSRLDRLLGGIVSWLHRLERIQGIEPAEVDSLKKAHFQDQDALGAALDSKAASLETIAADAQLDTKRVAELLGASLHQSAKPLIRGYLSRHWADFLCVAGIGFFASLVPLGRMSDAVRKAAALIKEKEPHVIALRDLLPYTPLTARDLQAKSAASPGEAKKLVDSVAGRYTVQTIQAGQTVEASKLSKGKTVLIGFSVFSLALKLKPATWDRALPASADLLFSKRGDPPGGLVYSVQLLNIENDSLTATVALPGNQAIEVAKWIGNSDAYLIWV